MMTILQVCTYAADYAGNFMASLFLLEKKMGEKGCRTIYAFPEAAAEKEWCREIQKRTKVYFLPQAKARILPKTYELFRRIYRENDISIVHTHFELYDIPATVMAPKGTRVFWHLHDPLKIHRGLRGLLWKIQYGVVGRKVQLLAVADHYRNLAVDLGFPRKQTRVILNGINLDRIPFVNPERTPQFDFLTFGWDFERKGGDLILDACDRLEKEGYAFKLLFNGNAQTWPKVEEYLQGRRPEWLTIGDPVENVGELFDASALFIQASRRETFSYAVCEAAYAGLPVISSDIAGLEWAHELPTVQFFESENTHQLYALMRAFLENRSVSDRDITQSRNVICNGYSLSVWAENVIRTYDLNE